MSKNVLVLLVALIALHGAGGRCAWAAVGGVAWEEVAKLIAFDGAVGASEFGWSVAVSGDTALVGDWSDDSIEPDQGSAYIFVRSEGVWAEEVKLLASDGADHDEFGWSVSISGDTALIGAVHDDDNGTNSGSAYVFVRGDEGWTEQAKLLASDGGFQDAFGRSVSLSGDTALIGAWGDGDNGPDAGAAYVFVRSGEVWTEQAKLLASDGSGGDTFGEAVSVSGDSALVGASRNNDNGTNSGSAYAFVRRGAVWTEQAKLLAGAAGDLVGNSVSLSGDTALIGAFGTDDNGSNSGAAYIFERTDDVWAEQPTLLASDGEARDGFGRSVSVSGSAALVGAHFDDDNGAFSGSAYVFVRTGGVWAERAKLLASDGSTGDMFGESVSLSGETALIGAFRADTANGLSSGSAYVFSRVPIFADGFESGDTSAWSSTVP